MTFSVTRDRGAFEWAGDTVFTVFCQAKNLLRTAHWRMIWDVLRFNACVRRLIAQDGASHHLDMSIGEYLDREGYSDAFRDDYLIVSCTLYSLFLPFLTLTLYLVRHFVSIERISP